MADSIREQIAQDIVAVLESAVDPIAIKFVSRNPIGSTDISIEQYPAVFVRTAQEDRTDETMSGGTLKFGNVDFQITGFVRVGAESNADQDRNLLIQCIEDALEADRKRNSLAMNSHISNVTTDEGDQYPIVRVDIIYNVLYKYTRGTT